MSPRMHVGVFLSLFLFCQFSLQVQSLEISVEDTIEKVENTPIIAGIPCTSRSLVSVVDGIETFIDTDNITLDDDGIESEDESSVIPIGSPPPCPDGYYCNLLGNKNEAAIDEMLGLCKPCPGSSTSCSPESTITDGTGSLDSFAYFMATVKECQAQCGEEKNVCSSDSPCPQGLFCNFEDGDGGFCEECPAHLHHCTIIKDLTGQALQSCESSCSIACTARGSVDIQEPAIVAASNEGASSTLYISNVNALHGSPQLKATGPVFDCGLGLKPCEGAEGSVCLIERGEIKFANKTMNCFAGGGVAAIIYNLEGSCDNFDASVFGAETYIPSISLTYPDAKALLKRAKAMSFDAPLLVTVDVGGYNVPPGRCHLGCTESNECEGTNLLCNYDNGDYGDCKKSESRAQCNDAPSFQFGTPHKECTYENEFCDFAFGSRGECRSCPESDGECFFKNLKREGLKECNEMCNDGVVQELESAPCKFCPKGSFAIGDIGNNYDSTDFEEVTTPCEFCASTSDSPCQSINRWDMKYPKRTIHMFGNEVECWAVAEFYRSMNIDANSAVCSSARFFNYRCGCSDTIGYMGANSDAKMIALVWVPRVGAILSILGSSLMIVSVLQDGQKRKKVIGELIIFLCGFDIIGSLGYAFTSLPTPEEDYIHGAVGNEASCTAQGFFIQIGTISLYINVSIAFYYLLIIRFSWRERKLKLSWFYYMLFIVPILIGAIFAFAGIPFYDNVILWCNNSGKYWSEIPVAIAISIATVIMVNLCWFVYKSERASKRFRRHSEEERASLSSAFFKQSLVYLGAFYLTWPPYLALQIMIANGYAFSDNYPFVIIAGTAVTLQGFWNFAFHTGLNGRIIGRGINNVWSSVKESGSVAFSKSRKFRKSSEMAEEKDKDIPAL